MLTKVEKFLKEKNAPEGTFEGMIYVCQGGSFISGTNDDTSDLDLRAITLLNEDYQIGMNKFQHTKLVSGENNINQYLDLDIEIFSPQYFINEAYNGEIVPIEMLYVNPEFVLLQHELFKPLFDNRELFLSKSIVFKYSGFIKKNKHQIQTPIERLKRPDKIERIRLFGYETKHAMKTIQLLRLCIEFLKTKEINLYRQDREELLDIKKGKYPLEQILKEIDELEKELESLLENTDLPKKPNFDKVNQLHKEYVKQLYRHLNIF